MTDINTRGKLPFTVVSSSVKTGYIAEITSSVGYNINIVNHHKDEYGGIENSPLQGPFTNQHVGGNQYRHVKLNEGNDSSENRSEGYIISASAGSVKIYGPDVNGVHKPRSLLTRDTTAKSPVNIKNIETSGNIAGNFEHNYQVVQSVGRRTSNNLINDNFLASGNLTTQFISGTSIYELPDITNNSKSIFVERFNAPGGKEVTSRGTLDREGEEYAPNNSLTTRNIRVRQPYYNQLTQHNKKFYLNENDVVSQLDSGTNETQFSKSKFNTSFYVGGEEASARGFYFKEDGTSLYITGQSSNLVHRYDLRIPFKISTAFFVNSSPVTSVSPRGITFKTDGTRMYLVSGTRIYRYDLSIPWDITSISSINNQNLGVSPTAVVFDETGTIMFITNVTGGNFVNKYILSTAWDITTVGSPVTLDISSKQSVVTGIHLDSSGRQMFICGDTPDSILKYFLNIKYDINSASYIEELSISEDTAIHDIYISPNKDKMFILGSQNDKIYEYSLFNAIKEHSVNRNTLRKTRSQTTRLIEQIYLTGSLATNLGDNFGHRVSINFDASIIAVGAREDESGSNGLGSGVVYILNSGSSGWSETARLTGSLATDAGDEFGTSIKLNTLGDVLAVGAYKDESGSNGLGSGVVYVFNSGSSGWNETARLTGSLATDADDGFGNRSISLNSSGNLLIVSAYNDESGSNGLGSGVVYVFNSGSSGWSETARLTGSLATDTGDSFGYAMSLNSSGDTIALGAYRDESGSNGSNSGVVYIFNSGSSGWVETSILTGSLATDADDEFGVSVSFSKENNILAVGSWQDTSGSNGTQSGVVYIFNSGSSGWSETAKVTGSLATEEDDWFGINVSLNSVGTILSVGAYNDESGSNGLGSGVVYIFRSGSQGWNETIRLTGSFAVNTGDRFGFSALLTEDGNRLIVGAYEDEITPNSGESGVVYANVLSHSESFSYVKHDNFWVQHSIPRTDLNYRWISDSISSEQQPIEYQSYRLPFSTENFYNSNGAFNDILFETKGPFGDHFGITGAIDKDEMFVSVYDNTMYRGRKYFRFSDINNTYIDLSSASGDINEKDFTICFWIKTSEYLNYDLSKSSFVDVYPYSSYDTTPEGLFFKPDGRRVYIVGNENDALYQFDLSTSWDLTTTSSAGNLPFGVSSTSPRGVYIRPDGLRAYVISSLPTVGTLVYHLSTAWDVTSATLATIIAFSEDSSPRDIYFKPDGTKMYVVGDATNKIYEKTLSSPWDLSSVQSTISKSVTGSPQALHIGSEGRRAIIFDKNDKKIYSYNMENAWDLNSNFNLIQDYTLDISSYEPSGTGLFIRESNQNEQSLYFVGTLAAAPTGRIHEFSFEGNSPIPLVQYSGSSSNNILFLNISPTGSNIILSGSSTTNVIKSTPTVNDGKWHLISLVSDLNTKIKRIRSIDQNIALNTTFTRTYVDGGLVTETTQLYKILDISGLFLSSKNNIGRYNYNLDDIILWNQALTEEQINEIYRISKSSYGEQPKKYIQHKLDNIKIPTPIHAYSSKIDKFTNILFDEIGNKNGTLVNFTSSINLYPQNTGLISYSTYFNGPYQGASWKSIRNSEHPVTRKLTTENTNIVSVVVPEGPREVLRTVRGTQVRFTLPATRKQGTILNVKESPVYINNKPLKHRFILKDSDDRNVGFELTHTYGNNLQYFANKQLNDTLGLNKKERQIYDTLFDYYSGEVDENENAIQRLVGYTYSETIFPKPGQALLKDVRQRTDYITDEPGYGPDGYDRQLGTQRVFWRDNQQDRMRTVNSYINSLGNSFDSVYSDLPFQTPSVAAFEFISESNNLQFITSSLVESITGSIIDFNYKNSSELNGFNGYNFILASSSNYLHYLLASSQFLELYFFKNETERMLLNSVLLNSSSYQYVDRKDPSSFRVSPKYTYEHSSLVISTTSNPQLPDTIYKNFCHDLGMNRITEKISGKNPWYDSYEEYYIDVKNLSNDYLKTYSKISEFKISDNIESLIDTYGGDATKIKLNNYHFCSISNNRDSIEQQNENFSEQSNINIIVSGIKKLFPYNGFYPQERSLQLVNYLKKSYLDKDAVKGGFLLVDEATEDQEVFYDEQDKLVQQSKQVAFLEPFFSPGIFYNLIKSGIAVSWNVYTGSLPVGLLNSLSKPPDYTIDFESLINLDNIALSSSSGQNNRILKFKDLNSPAKSEDYSSTIQIGLFQSFFEITKKGSPIYSLSINNFLAESINFFLKDSKLNSFISRPDTDFIFDSSKTYYMDVVLRKKDIVMCEAHSSSLFYNFGKMNGRYFGPSFWTGSNGDRTRIAGNYLLAETIRDPGYCMFTPPYFYGDSIARLSFKPPNSGKFTLDDILSPQNLSIEYINTGFVDDSIYPSGSLYSSFVMPLRSSIKLDGKIETRQQTVDLASSQLARSTLANLRSSLVGSTTNVSGINRWVISPKMEVPVLDFSNQDFVVSNSILTQSYADEQLKALYSYHTPPTASGFGRGMWSGYGEIPSEDKGIFIELRESYPRELIGKYDLITRKFTESNTGSLLQVCGFDQENDQLSKRIGEIADSRQISEAIVIIPYLDNSKNNQTIIYYRGEDPQALSANGTVTIEGHNLLRIDIDMFNHQKLNVLSGKPAVDKKLFLDIDGMIEETSISKMIKLMSKYVLPPNFDFLINPEIRPFVMYIAEFTSTLDKQDLADIWQGVMPKIAMRAEREEQVISHRNSIFDFFHGQGLPKDVKFMIFKAKKRAEINYYKMAADSTDDGLFPSIQAGKPPSPYSFNWPYDYCSLVETARVDVEIDYINKSGSNIT